jgi:DHA1 family bicyclomycin/chloramphenicol resistance-like MFS transporter
MRRTTEVALILGLVVGIGPLSIDMYLPALPAMSDSLAAGATGLQLTLTACLAGLALGQLVSGPLSDTLGRRPPLLVALASYALASVACALSASAPLLVGARLAQGIAGGAATVVARAIVRDLHTGAAAARYFTALMLVNGVAPVISPVVGGQLLRITSWRAIFVALAAFAVVLGAWILRGLPETLPASRRRSGAAGDMVGVMRTLLTDGVFMRYALAAGFAFGAAFAYLAGSPFVLQNVFGASPQAYALLFALNAAGLIAASQVNRVLLRRFDPRTLLTAAVPAAAIGGIGVLVASASSSRSIATMVVPSFVLVSSLGVILPNAAALALSGYGESAGSASAVFGLLQYAAGAALAPLAGIAGSDTALPMGVLTAVLAVAALVVLVRRPIVAPGPVLAPEKGDLCSSALTGS